MNTMAHVAGLLAALWLSVFAFETLSNSYLGVALLVVFMMLIPMAINAVSDDVRAYKGRRS
tara:strand:- start:152 stop:334 length:183 start_codon:yes stop_codon:yes gene_type:complete